MELKELNSQLEIVFENVLKYKPTDYIYHFDQSVFNTKISDIIEGTSENITTKFTERNIEVLTEMLHIISNFKIGEMLKALYEIDGITLSDYGIDKFKFNTHFVSKISIIAICSKCGNSCYVNLKARKDVILYKGSNNEIRFLCSADNICQLCSKNDLNSFLLDCSRSMVEIQKCLPLDFSSEVYVGYHAYKNIMYIISQIGEETLYENLSDNENYFDLLINRYRPVICELYAAHIIKFITIFKEGNGFYFRFALHPKIRIDTGAMSEDEIMSHLIAMNFKAIKQRFTLLFEKEISFSLDFEQTILLSLENLSLCHMSLILFWLEKDFFWAQSNIDSFKLLNYMKLNLKKKIEQIQTKHYELEKYVRYCEFEDQEFLLIQSILPHKTTTEYKMLSPRQILNEYRLQKGI